MHLHEYEFQNQAVAEIVAAARKLLPKKTGAAILLDAPTGAGKTVTAAKALAALAEQYEGALAFIWIAPNKLQEQSRAKLVAIYGENRTLSCLTADELRGAEIEDRSVLFLNWASVNKKDNRLRRDETGTETGRTLAELLETTRAAGRKIVLVIDESHHDVNGVQAQIVVSSIIEPDLTLEISATPVLKGYDYRHTILREDVVRAGVIRKQFVINPTIKESLTVEDGEVRIESPGTAKALLDVALAHRARLAQAFEVAGSTVNPLMLVQLPVKGNGPPEVREQIEDRLQAQHGISTANGKLAVWLADEKVNLDDVEAKNSPVEVLFFKEAIALGWDCPRAHILVSLREMDSPIFTAQVLGRILRQPEQRHYDNALLDTAYVFTNYPQFTLEKQLETVMATRLVTAQRPLVFPLPCWRETNADQRLFLSESVCRAIHGHKRLLANIHHRGPVTGAMVSDLVLETIDVPGEERTVTHAGDVAYELNEEQLEDRLAQLTRDLVARTASQVAGRGFVRRALLEAAREVLASATQGITEKAVLETILHRENRMAFERMVEAGIEEVARDFDGRKRGFEREESWTVPANKVLPWSATVEGFRKCVYSPVLRGEMNPYELAFAQLLDAHPEVEAWVKNDDRGQEHFAILYEADKTRQFYPDFLVLLTGGRYAIWETKGHASTAQDKETGLKADALAAYLKELRAQGLDVQGGIVVKDDKRRRWMLNDSEAYEWDEPLTGWKPFEVARSQT